jgi:predicted acylesterase/phospholipase RssA
MNWCWRRAQGGDKSKKVPDPEPLDAANQPPIDRYCDLVLTGGVTDGVIYPWAVLELARAYRFKNIGGTSVGALAAALTASAEYARRQGFLSGFNEVVLKIPRKLAEDVNNSGRTRIFTLFQPSKANRRLFKLFVALVGPDGLTFEPTPLSSDTSVPAKTTSSAAGERSPKARNSNAFVKFVKGVWQFLKLVRLGLCAYVGAALLGLFISIILIVVGRHLLSLSMPNSNGPRIGIAIVVGLLTLAGVFVLVLAFILIRIYCDVVKGLVPNGFGMCTGGHAEGVPNDEPSLVEWLHEGIQDAARKPFDQPLTFQDLWDAPGGPIPAAGAAASRTQKTRSIDLRMVTTNLTHGRPYRFPLDDETTRLFFKVEDLKPFFPESVLNHLIKHSKCYQPAGPEDPPQSCETRSILELPVADLPVVVAARLSLSFPVLFSAVPLWAIDYEPEWKERRVRRCRFSDGAICSSFPIHLFDAAIPRWPTFGIFLATRSIFRKNQFVWLPQRHDEGLFDSWSRFDDKRSLATGEDVPPLKRLVSFLTSIVFTAMNWDDLTAMRMPGVRDRVVRIYRDQGDGGLNLEITGDKIMEMASGFGQLAGKELVDKFIACSIDNSPSVGWNEHRWVRFNTFLVGLRERIEALRAAAETAAYCKPLSQQIREATTERPLRGSDPSGIPLAGPQAEDLEHLLTALERVESAFRQATMPQPYQPEPPPTLHIRPPL